MFDDLKMTLMKSDYSTFNKDLSLEITNLRGTINSYLSLDHKIENKLKSLTNSQKLAFKISIDSK